MEKVEVKTEKFEEVDPGTPLNYGIQRQQFINAIKESPRSQIR